MLGKIVVVGLQRPDQIRHRCRGVRELTSVSLLKADHREVTRATEARDARAVGIHPERRQPAQRAGAEKRDGIGRWINAGRPEPVRPHLQSGDRTWRSSTWISTVRASWRCSQRHP